MGWREEYKQCFTEDEKEEVACGHQTLQTEKKLKLSHFRERRSCPFEPTQSIPTKCDLLQVRGQSLGYLKAAHTDSHHTDAPDSVTGLTISPDY